MTYNMNINKYETNDLYKFIRIQELMHFVNQIWKFNNI